jgi:hypothetical protein
MVKRYFFPVLLSFITTSLLAQHCPWDGSSMIMVDIKKNPSVQIQKIYLLDSTGKVVISKHYYGAEVQEDSAIFRRNPSGDNKNEPYRRGDQYFSFAKDYLILELGAHNQPLPYHLLIVFTSGNKLLHKEVPLPDQQIHQLCTLNKKLWSGREKPVSVQL